MKKWVVWQHTQSKNRCMDGFLVHGEGSVVVLGLDAPRLELVVQAIAEPHGGVLRCRVVGVRSR